MYTKNIWFYWEEEKESGIYRATRILEIVEMPQSSYLNFLSLSNLFILSIISISYDFITYRYFVTYPIVYYDLKFNSTIAAFQSSNKKEYSISVTYCFWCYQ